MADTPTLTLVYATFTVSGIHYWKDAPEGSILRSPHRHLFHFKVCKQVHHDDRDVEFLALGSQAQTMLCLKNSQSNTSGSTLAFGNKSCEVIARELLEALDLYSCEVSEDGENGAIITRQ